MEYYKNLKEVESYFTNEFKSHNYDNISDRIVYTQKALSKLKKLKNELISLSIEVVDGFYVLNKTVVIFRVKDDVFNSFGIGTYYIENDMTINEYIRYAFDEKNDTFIYSGDSFKQLPKLLNYCFREKYQNKLKEDHDNMTKDLVIKNNRGTLVSLKELNGYHSYIIVNKSDVNIMYQNKECYILSELRYNGGKPIRSYLINKETGESLFNCRTRKELLNKIRGQ